MSTHQIYLEEAILESRRSVESGSSPFGAVIVKEGEIIARAHNQVVPNNDPTAHAEVMCIRAACQKLNTFDLTGCVLYTSCEPCPMCLNAIKWANITEVYYSSDRTDADAIGFRDKAFYDENCVNLHRIDLPQSRDIMQDWYVSASKKPY